MSMKVAVIGLGKLGICTAACIASKKHKVYGFDANPEFMEKFRNKENPISETGLDELLEKSWDNLIFAESIEEAVKNTDIALIVVPTPSMADGRFTNEYLHNVLDVIGNAIKDKDSFYIIDVVSTVMPRSSVDQFVPKLEKLSGKKCGKDFGLIYNPEFIALGSVVKNFLNPDMVLIGASDEKSAQTTKKLYEEVVDNKPQFNIMSLTSAEIAKLSLNCYVTMKISFANELADICENIEGADIDSITSALGGDTRIGAKYLKAGLGFGGPCFPRDNKAFQSFAEEFGIDTHLSPQVVKVNDRVVERVVGAFKKAEAPNKKVAVLGMSYKTGTHIIEESQSVDIAVELADAGYDVYVHDPMALEEVKKHTNGSVKCCEDIMECLKDSGGIILSMNWPEYDNIDWSKVNEIVAQDAVFVDCWRTLAPEKISRMKYRAVGVKS